jgi:hypothetical protein
MSKFLIVLVIICQLTLYSYVHTVQWSFGNTYSKISAVLTTERIGKLITETTLCLNHKLTIRECSEITNNLEYPQLNKLRKELHTTYSIWVTESSNVQYLQIQFGREDYDTCVYLFSSDMTEKFKTAKDERMVTGSQGRIYLHHVRK